MPERSYRVLLWTLALVGLAADQASKYGVFASLYKVEEDPFDGAIVRPRPFAIFQTEPESRFFSSVADTSQAGELRGFFLEANFEDRLDDRGRPVPHVNHGALFGFMQGKKESANWTFALISLAAAAAIVYWSRQKNTAKDRWLCISLGLILAGTLGNFYDRLVFHGVRDFLHWNLWFDWPVFNVADCCLVVGASLLLLQAFFAPASRRSPQESEQAELAVQATNQG
jgi:lipoprotein signal peptidase